MTSLSARFTNGNHVSGVMIDHYPLSGSSTSHRADALRDGVLVEVPLNLSIEAGIKIPVALTSEAWYYIDPGNLDELPGQSVTGRLWDLLHVFRVMASQARHSDRVLFNVAFLMPISK